MVEVRGIEPLAPCMQSRCSPAELHPPVRATLEILAQAEGYGAGIKALTERLMYPGILPQPPAALW